MLHMNLPVVDTLHPQINKFNMAMKIKAIIDLMTAPGDSFCFNWVLREFFIDNSKSLTGIIHCFNPKAHDLLPPTTGALRSLVTVFLSLAPPCIWLSRAPLSCALPEDFGGGPDLCAGGGGGPGGGGGGGGIFLFYDCLTPPVTNNVFHLHGTKKIWVLNKKSEEKSICNFNSKLVRVELELRHLLAS